ncbi:hypothetical protein ACS0TY_017220 [Phlomoides rotata]
MAKEIQNITWLISSKRATMLGPMKTIWGTPSLVARHRGSGLAKVLPFYLSMILPLCDISDGTFHMDLEERKTSNPFVLSSSLRSFKDMDYVKPNERGPKAERHIGVSRLQGSRSNGRSFSHVVVSSFLTDPIGCS